MKRILYLTTLAVLFIIISTTTLSAKELFNDSREITLNESKDETRHIGKEKDVEPDEAVTPRCSILQLAYAYLSNNIVSIDFNGFTETATVTITNESTGETVYSETCSNPVTLYIDLNGEKSGEYSIEIETDDIFLEGYFNL